MNFIGLMCAAAAGAGQVSLFLYHSCLPCAEFVTLAFDELALR